MIRKTAMMVLAIFMLTMVSFPAFASEPEQPAQQITLQQAIDMALDRSSLLKSKEYAKDQAWEIRSDAAENVHFMPSGPAGGFMESAFTGLMQSSLNYRMKGKELEQAQKQVKVNAYTKYINVLIAQEKVKYNETALEKDKLAERVVQAYGLVGMAATPELAGAKSRTGASKAALQAAKESLEKAYIELNSMIGLQTDEKPELVDALDFEEFSIPNIQTEISRALTNNETLWNLEQLVNLQRMDLKYFNYGPGSGQLQSYEIEKYDVNIAESNVVEFRKQVKEGVQALYKDIKALEEQYNMVYSSVSALKEQLRAVQARYDVGMATKLEITEAKTAMAEIEKNLAEMRYNHSIMVANFKNMTGKDLLA